MILINYHHMTFTHLMDLQLLCLRICIYNIDWVVGTAIFICKGGQVNDKN